MPTEDPLVYLSDEEADALIKRIMALPKNDRDIIERKIDRLLGMSQIP